MWFLVPLVVSKLRYGVMVDAGSSGCRCHIYKWEKGLSIPNVQPISTNSKDAVMKISIKLADARDDPTVVGRIFDQMIKFVAERVPAEDLAKTAFFVYATGGMRFLSVEDQDTITQQVFLHIKNNSPFKVKPHYIRIIDGIEEGVYGWVSVNHLLGNLVNHRPTVGALDMGGASYQIAIEIGNGVKSSSQHVVNIGNRKIPVFAHSYLGYGANAAIAKLTKAIYTITGNTTIYHPCQIKNHEEQFDKYKTIGTGDFERCSELINALLLEESAFADIAVPSLSQTTKFVAMASFYYVNDFFKLAENSSLDQLKDVSKEYCSTDWSIISERHKGNDFASTYCWYSIYQWNMLSKGYKFEKSDVSVVKAGEIDGVDLSWTIGAMLSKIADIEIVEKAPMPYMTILIANLVAVFIVLPIAYILNKRSRMLRRMSNSRPLKP